MVEEKVEEAQEKKVGVVITMIDLLILCPFAFKVFIHLSDLKQYCGTATT